MFKHSSIVKRLLRTRTYVNERNFSSCVSVKSWSPLHQLWNAGKKKECLEVYFKAPNTFYASFLLTKKEYSVDEHVKIFEAIPSEKRNVRVLVPMIFSLHRNSKDTQLLINELASRIDIITDDELRKLPQFYVQLILQFLLQGKFCDHAILWYSRTEKLVVYSDVHLKGLLKILMEKPHQHSSLIENVMVKLQNPNIVQFTKYVQTVLVKDHKKAILLVETMKNVKVNEVVFLVLISFCTENKLLKEGQHVHKLVHDNNINSLKVDNSLMNFYTKCGMPDEAIDIFERLKRDKKPMNVFTWNCAIQALAEKKLPKQAFEIFKEMEQHGITPNEITFIILLSICAENKLLKEGQHVHKLVHDNNINSLQVEISLMNFYTKCGMPDESIEIFERLKRDKKPMDIVTWTCAIQALAEKKLPKQAFELFKEMEQHGITPNEVTFNILLGVCTEHKLIEEGKSIHHSIKQLSNHNLLLNNSIMNFYTKCGMPDEAIEIFERLKRDKKPMDAITWTCAIQALAEKKLPKQAFEIFKEMEQHGNTPNEATFNILLGVCTEHRLIEEGKSIHHSIKQLSNHNLLLNNSIMNFYTKCGMPDEAIEIFERLKCDKKPMDVVTWTCAIQALAEKKLPKQAFELFKEMEQHGITPNEITFNILLSICTEHKLIEEGQHVHKLIHDNNINSLKVEISLMNFYTKCMIKLLIF